MNDHPNPAYILLGAIAVLAILATLYVLQKRKEKSSSLPAPSPAITTPEPTTPPPSSKTKFDPRTVLSPIKSELFGRITSFDPAPEELHGQLPVTMRFIRPLPHADGAGYVLAALGKPLAFRGEPRSFLVVAGHWEGSRISRGMKGLPIKVAVVLDESLAMDSSLDFAKVEYVAIGLCDEIPKDEFFASAPQS